MSSTRPRSSSTLCPRGDGLAARPVKRAKRCAASSTSATAITIAVSASAPLGWESQRGCRIGIDLNGNGGGRKPGTHERGAGGLRIAHEMADVIEKNLAADGKLAIRRE